MTTFEAPTETVVVIPISEFQHVAQLRPLTRCDESDPMSLVRLRSDGHYRKWTATDRNEGACLRGGPDRATYDVCLSWAQVRAAMAFGRNDPGLDISVKLHESDGTPLITVSGPFGSSTTWNRGITVPELNDIKISEERIGGIAVVPADMLIEAMSAAAYEREFENGESVDRLTTVAFDDGLLILQKRSPASGLIKYQMPAEYASSEVAITLDPNAAGRVLAIAGRDDDVTITLSINNYDPVWFKGSGWEGFVYPTTSPIRRATEHAESIIHKIYGPAAMNRDADGSYPLVTSGNAVSAKIVCDDNDVPWLNVVSLVAVDVPATPDLFVELNDYNTNCQQVRLAYTDGQVIACVDLVAGTLDEPELELAVDRIRDVAGNIMPLLTAVIGGVIPDDDYETRWAAYRNTVVEAELSQGIRTTLTGEHAVEEFPFIDRCFVITGCNPMGTRSTEEQIESAHNWLAHRIVDNGGTFVKGAGKSIDGSHREESLIVWGVNRDFMRSLGRQVQQDAIFEIDRHTVHLVACTSSQIETWPRRKTTVDWQQLSLF